MEETFKWKSWLYPPGQKEGNWLKLKIKEPILINSENSVYTNGDRQSLKITGRRLMDKIVESYIKTIFENVNQKKVKLFFKINLVYR